MKSNICLEVSFLAGTDIRAAIEEAKIKALEWDVAYVTFKFNGVSVSIQRGTDVEKAVVQFHHSLKYGSTYMVGGK